jgi:hypothetical protein
MVSMQSAIAVDVASQFKSSQATLKSATPSPSMSMAFCGKAASSISRARRKSGLKIPAAHQGRQVGTAAWIGGGGVALGGDGVVVWVWCGVCGDGGGEVALGGGGVV